MGGTTSVISFAAQAGGQQLSQTLLDYAARAKRGAMIDYAFHLTLTDLYVPSFEEDLAKLVTAGHRSLKIFTTYNIQLRDPEVLKVLTLARKYGALVCVHAENDAIIARAKNALLAAGKTAPKDHATSRPRMAELEAVERMCRSLNIWISLSCCFTYQPKRARLRCRLRSGAARGFGPKPVRIIC